MTIQLALYQGPAPTKLRQLAHRLICWRTGGPYSHVELLDAQGKGWSSSWLDGGVRNKLIDFSTDRWALIWIEGDLERAVAWFQAHDGDRYGWLAMVLAFLLPFRVSNSNYRFCSKAVAEALGLPDAWRTSPNDLAHRALESAA